MTINWEELLMYKIELKKKIVGPHTITYLHKIVNIPIPPFVGMTISVGSYQESIVRIDLVGNENKWEICAWISHINHSRSEQNEFLACVESEIETGWKEDT